MSVITVKINDVDVSKYIKECDSIPVYQRNRTGEPIADTINIRVMYAYTTAIEIDDVVEVTIDGNAMFLGYVKEVKDLPGTKSYNVEIASYILKLDDYTVRNSTFLNKIYLVTDYSPKQDFLPAAVNTGTATITIVGHGFADEEVVMLTSTGVLPDGITANQQYFIDRLGPDDFQLTLDRLTPIAITTQGTGTHSITSDVDLNSFCRRDNEDFPNASIKWILKKAFETVGMTLTTTSLDSSYIYNKIISATTYYYTLGDLCLDTRMMQVIGYPYATSTPAAEDAGYQITLFDLFKLMCSIFRLSVRYTGNTTNKEFTLVENTATPYTITDDFIYSKSTDEINNSLDTVFGTEYFSDRADYGGVTLTDLTAGESIECSNPVIQYQYPDNLKILLRKQTGTPADGEVETTDYMDIKDAAGLFIQANEVDWSIVTFQTDIQSTIRSVKEVWIEPASKTFKIVQMEVL